MSINKKLLHAGKHTLWVLPLWAGIFLSGCAPVILTGAVAGAGATLVSDRRSATALLEDQAIEMQATDSIYSDKKLGKNVRITVTSYNRLVLLTGEAQSQEMRLKAANIVKQLSAVREVYNEIEVADTLDLNKRTHDSWITSKVKARLMANRGLFTRTKVMTSNGTVYLMGLATEQEREEASRLVRDIEGIERVVGLFEPIGTSRGIAAEDRGKVPILSAPSDLAPDEAEVLAEEETDLSIIPLSPPEKKTLPMVSSDN